MRSSVHEGARWRLKFLNEDSEYVEIPRDKYEKLEAAVKEMNTPYHSASDFVHTQIDEVLEKYDKWLEEKDALEKKQRKRV